MMTKTERKYTKVSSMKGLCDTLSAKGERIALKYYNKKRELCTLSYGDFVAGAKNFTAGLANRGLDKKRVAIIGETSAMWLMSYVSATASGGIAIPLDRELAISEIKNFLLRAHADILVFSSSFNEKFAELFECDCGISLFVAMDDEGMDRKSEKLASFDEIASEGKNKNPSYDFPVCENAMREAEYLFTSGTTGTSKCVMLSEMNIITAVNSACECVNFFPDDVLVSVLPIHHTYELCCLFAGLDYGMEIFINDSLKHVIRNFAQFKPTGLVLVPIFVNTMYKKIWDEAKKKGKDNTLRFALKASRGLRAVGLDVRRLLFKDVLDAFGGRLEKIVCGGAPLNPEIAKRFEEFGICIMEGYGITECSPLISVNPYYNLKHGSVGPAVDGCEVKIDGAEPDGNGHIVGEILARGKNVMLGYLGDEEETKRVFTEDGWFRTGDIGYLDSDNYIYITGRKKSVIVLENGKNVFPEEIEEYISEIEKISECVVVGRKQAGGEVVLTAVVYPAYDKLAKPDDAEAVSAEIKAEINKMNKKLVGYKQVRQIEIVDHEFDKTTSRKIKRHLVK